MFEILCLLGVLVKAIWGCAITGSINSLALSSSFSMVNSPQTLNIVQVYTFTDESGRPCPASMTGEQTIIADSTTWLAQPMIFTNTPGVPVTVTYGFPSLTLSMFATLGPSVSRIGTFFASGNVSPTGSGAGFYAIPFQTPTSSVSTITTSVPVRTTSMSTTRTTSRVSSTTTSTSPPTSTHTDPPSPGLSGGAIGGIVGGVIGGFAILGVLTFFLLRRRKQVAPPPPQLYDPVQMASKNAGQYLSPGQSYYPAQGGLRYPDPDDYARPRDVVGGRTSTAY